MSTTAPRHENQEEEGDSFSSLSSPMSSPPASPSAQLSNEHTHAQEIVQSNFDGPAPDFPARSAAAVAAAAASSVAAQANAQPQEAPPQAPARKKPGRKPKPVDPNDPVAVKKAQRNAQRTAKRQIAKEAERAIANANNPTPPVVVGAAAVAKKKKTSNLNQQAKITDFRTNDVPILKSNADPPAPSQNGKNEDIPTSSSGFGAFPPVMTAPRPMMNRTPGGQNYDPIRSNYDPVRETVVNHTPASFSAQTSPIPPQSLNRASASPSIASLVEPPNHIPQSPSHQSFFNQQARLQQHDLQPPIPPSPTHARLAPSPMIPSSMSSNPPAAMHVAQPTEFTSTVGTTKKQAPINSTSTTSSSTAHSPKPLKAGKDPLPPPLPGSGGGLLQNGMLGGIGSTGAGTEFRAPTVILHIPMNGETNRYVNFTKMAEERYGWDALHPRIAAQRDRLARIEAASAALEKSGAGRESGDEMSLDMSEGEGSNAEMGGMSDGRTGTDGGKKPVKKRKSKEDEYDKDDGFVDDSDLLWEQQAAASKDGFFVYSGPLVPEGEKPVLDRSEGPTKRGRGRGRGGASRAVVAARGGSATASAAGAGPRGGGITRKPRITKAAREQMILEKKERERMGMATTTFAPNMTQLASASANAANHGGTQMVFNN